MRKEVDLMVNEQDWKFDEKKASTALQELSCHILNPLNDDSVFELVKVITYCMDLEQALDKACKELVRMCEQTKCRDCHFVKEQVDCNNDCPVQGNLTSFDWKEWLKRNV